MRKYYSQGLSGHKGFEDIEKFRILVLAIFNQFNEKGYFQEYFGYICQDSDSGYAQGKAGNVEAFFLLKLRKNSLYPVTKKIFNYKEEDLFDVIELLYDCVSKPDEGYHHSFCGYHYSDFQQESGQEEFREEINHILGDYKDGFELTDEGEILTLIEPDMVNLLEAKLTTKDANIQKKLKSATNRYRKSRTNLDERLIAVRELADILEALRPTAKAVLNKKDENDLFEIANNFGIRHHNQKQKTDYDKSIWCSWMFYFYLATIHASLRLIERESIR